MAVPLSALREHAIILSLAGRQESALQERAIFSTSLTPEELSQFDFNDHSTLEPLIVAVSAVCMALISSVVCLRLLVRRFYTGRFFLDDYLVILASIFTIVVCSVVIAATKYGLGKHVWNLNFSNIIAELKVCIQLMFVANIFYSAAIAFTKMSIIASYMNIFNPRGLLKIVLQVTGFITIGLGVASIPATIFECIPVDGAWSITDSHAKCYTFVHFLYASTAINVATDLVLCVVPIPLFWRLQLPRRQKVMISGLFFLGGFACIASIIRLAYLHLLENPIDVTYDLVSSVMWTIAECTIGIVCVSLPPLRSLLAKILPSIFRSPQLTDKRSGPGAPKAAAAANAAAAGYPTDRTSKNLRGNMFSDKFSEKFRNSSKTSKSSKSTDIMVLSSLTTRHSHYSLKSDAPDVPDKDDDYKNRLAKQLGMNSRIGGVSVHISAGGHDDVDDATMVNSSSDTKSRRTNSDVEMGHVRSGKPKDPFGDA